ncbi:ATP-binding protein [Kutzneria sp. CA-103260]|uniref:ATP-binding protein n=1 Tax=Kutzneria sp. CA-103260 TaxID=2802641 RepID=UPI001BA9E4D3|nr:LuxR C-terminal-related transcriptional regulator [Kutzneria sp. CA-103260]QUQ72325.1 LuxR family transcriptional regulator [Kutzneria sp. CA-103260]
MGRTAEVAELRRLLAASRVLTVTGVGGVGKSRLAVRLAGQVRRLWRDGIRYVDLGPLAAVPRLKEGLRDKELLLVLDNCEHLVQETAELVSEVVGACPGVRVVATSRHVLGIAGEQIYQLRPLSIEDEAVALFADRAGMALTAQNRATVAGICRGVDGITLAVEQAARTRVAGESAEDPMAATIGRSHGLCTPEERDMWARLAVFSGSFSLEAAEDVCGDVLDLVTSLVDKSVLVLERGGRYRMWSPVRRYGAERCPERLRIGHRDHFRRVVLKAREDWFAGWQGEAVDAVRADLDNVRAALEFCANEPGEAEAGLEMVAALSYYWICCGAVEEGRRWSARMLALCPKATVDRGTALWTYAMLTTMQGAVAVEAAEELARAFDDDRLAALTDFVKAGKSFATGDHAVARELFPPVAERLAAIGYSASAVTALNAAAISTVFTGDAEAAAEIARRSLDMCDRQGEQWGRSLAHFASAMANWARGDLDRAVADLRRGARYVRRFGDMLALAMHVELRIWIAVAAGDLPLAARLFGASSRAWPLVGGRVLLESPSWLGPHLKCERQTRAALGRDAFNAAYAHGVAQCPDASGILDFVFGESADRPGKVRNGVLTPREIQVVELVATGLPNKEIANRLLVTQRTVETHVNHVLTKLRLSRRAQITAWVSARSRST